MAAPPVRPEDFKASIPAANAKLCEKMLLALIKFPTLVYRLIAWAMKADGTPTDDFKAWFGVAVGQLVPPTNLNATEGTYTNKISITWNQVSGATYYEVFRGDSNNPAAATSLGTTTTPSYVDYTAVANQVHWYFVKSKNATDTSDFSIGESGFTDTISGDVPGGGSAPTGERIFTQDASFTVPAGVTTVEIEAWGAGGGGGGSGVTWLPVGQPWRGGGGGGAGEYIHVKQVSVAPGDVLSVVVGATGGAGGSGGEDNDPGVSGRPSIVTLAGAVLVRANGGSGGAAGGTDTGMFGAGGTGGQINDGDLILQEPGENGTSGTSDPYTPSGGTGGAANNGGNNYGGDGGVKADGTAGGPGKVKFIWPGAA